MSKPIGFVHIYDTIQIWERISTPGHRPQDRTTDVHASQPFWHPCQRPASRSRKPATLPWAWTLCRHREAVQSLWTCLPTSFFIRIPLIRRRVPSITHTIIYTHTETFIKCSVYTSRDILYLLCYIPPRWFVRRIVLYMLHEYQICVYSRLYHIDTIIYLSLIHIWRCRRSTLCRSRWSPYH